MSEGRRKLQVENDKSYFQQEVELQSEIDELWKLMQFAKKSYSKVKQGNNCEVRWRVKNDEGK